MFQGAMDQVDALVERQRCADDIFLTADHLPERHAAESATVQGCSRVGNPAVNLPPIGIGDSENAGVRRHRATPIQAVGRLNGYSTVPPLPTEGHPLHTTTYPVFSDEYGMLFVPHDALREVELVGLQGRRIVAQVRVSTPNVGGVAGRGHPGDLTEQGCRSRLNSSSETKSFSSGRSLARSVRCVGFDFSGCRATSSDE